MAKLQKPKRTPSKSARNDHKYVGSAELRRRAEREYLRDQDANGAEWHWEHGGFCKYVSVATFKEWAAAGDWHQQRLAYWRDIQDRLLRAMADRILKSEIESLNDMIEMKNVVKEMLEPVKDADGNILRRDGVPIFKTEVPSFEKLVKAFLDLDQRIGLRSGDVTGRIAVSHEGGSKIIDATPTARLKSHTLTEDEARALARQLLLSRNPALAGGEPAEDEDEG